MSHQDLIILTGVGSYRFLPPFEIKLYSYRRTTFVNLFLFFDTVT